MIYGLPSTQPSCRCGFIVLLLLSMMAPPCTAQKGEGFGGEVEVTIINIDVFVRDQEGQPVRGLTADDFEVFENGRPVEVTNFLAVDGDPSSITYSDSAQKPPRDGAGPVVRDPPQPARLVLFIHDEALHPHRRNRALDDLAVFIGEELPKWVTVTVLRAGAGGLTVVLDHADAPEPVLNVLSEIRRGTGSSHLAESRYRRMVGLVSGAEDLDGALREARVYSQEVRADALTAIRSLEAAVAMFAGSDERTLLLYVGEGFPAEPGLEAFSVIDDMYGNPGVLTYASNYRVHNEINDLLASANRAGVTISAFDPRGLETGVSSGADVSGSIASAGGPAIESLRRSMRHAPLMDLTGETGGHLVRSSNTATGLLGGLADDLSVYYSIGFPSRESNVDKERRIKVSVRRPGVDVRYRRSARPLTAAERRVTRTLSALYMPIEDNPLDVSVRLLDANANGSKREVPLDLLIPTEHILLVPEGQMAAVSLEALIASRDDGGAASSVRRVEISGTIPAAADDGQRMVLRHRITLRLKPGRHRLAITIHDQYGEATSILTNEVEVE
jgi:VWFA-related protein